MQFSPEASLVVARYPLRRPQCKSASWRQAEIAALRARSWTWCRGSRSPGSYSNTRSVRSRIACGIFIPKACAVLALMISSILVGCSMATSPGFAPFKILST